MPAYFVSRHAGARDWASEQGLRVDRLVPHLTVEMVVAGDIVIGTLPCSLAADVCSRGARYLHLTLDLPVELRGKELTAADMRACGARLEEYRVSRVG